ncbi:MAG: hypothetical protein ACLP9D_08710 [Candidatus Bathyarchaeia archaeon]
MLPLIVVELAKPPTRLTFTVAFFLKDTQNLIDAVLPTADMNGCES